MSSNSFKIVFYLLFPALYLACSYFYDPIKPQISYQLDDSENKQLLIICSAPEPPEECRVKRFLLYSGIVAIKDLSAIEGSPKVTFTVSNLTAEYRCSYVLEVKDQLLHLIKSPRSDKITPTIPEDKKRTESTEGDPRIMADYTTTNRIRLVLAIALIILACGFIIEFWISSNKDGQCS
ncbi:uncharacterized protein LOC122926703 isoform X3 [Bufo gargarizans]|uniref:uncharacterized protein LOC122926703 isoform X3 n=1 Tax=Bufo gargarizans TaxID=30331 RepID=UPI001CF2FBEC|nr:uncharacterized protein LOC122926703 isoform X3 [Bufo gargarizans]